MRIVRCIYLSKNIIRYDLLISCPGDVQNEISLIKESVEEFNEKFSDTLGVMVQPRHWKSSSFSQSGNKPQELLNEQFVVGCDAAVAVFWTRFGTPTDKYESGTEEEIEIMLDAGKQVFMYFSEKAVSPSNLDIEQYEKIKKFKEKYKDRGIFFQYYKGLYRYFILKKQKEEYENQNVPNLILRGISMDSTVEDIVHIRKFNTDTYYDIAETLKKIKKQYKTISDIKIEYSSLLSGNQLFVNKKVEIDENIKQILKSFAKQLSIEVCEDFFDLGGLSENTFGTISALGRHNFVGGENEKEKYDLITSLYNIILELMSWIPIAEAFGELDCLYLALENNGTSVDEDVEITLYFNKDDLLDITDRPYLDDTVAEYLIEKCNLSEIFEIESSADYLSYDDSIKQMPQINLAHQNMGILGFNRRNYQEEYAEEFADALVYEIFDKNDMKVVKLHIDYIKHNSIVAVMRM